MVPSRIHTAEVLIMLVLSRCCPKDKRILSLLLLMERSGISWTSF